MLQEHPFKEPVKQDEIAHVALACSCKGVFLDYLSDAFGSQGYVQAFYKGLKSLS